MGKVIMAGGGGGADTSVVTATAADVLENKVIVDQDGNPLTGTMTNRNVVDGTIGGINSSYPSIAVHKGDNIQIGTTTVSNESLVALRVPDGYYDGHNYVGVPQADAATNLGLTAAKIATGNTILGVAGTYKGLGNATAAQVLSGKTFSTASLSNTAGTMNNYSGYTSTSNYVSSTFRSGATNYVFASPGGTGYYSTSSYLRIPATNLAAGNIKKGVSILGITGTFEGYVSDTLYFFNSGTWSNLSTTGITYIGTKKSLDAPGSLKSSNVYVSGSNMVITGTSDGKDNNSVYVAGRLNQTVNLTNYNYLKFKYNSNSVGTNTPIRNAYVYISTDPKTVNKYTSGAYMSNTGIGILDISSITGNYYIYIGATFQTLYNKTGSASYVYLTQLFLSKS